MKTLSAPVRSDLSPVVVSMLCFVRHSGGNEMATDTYLFGRSAGELQRLARQAALVELETEELFLRSRITAGMQVLEIGSGAGDVAMLAGRMVRPDGSDNGSERPADSVGLAAGRVAAAANINARFEVGDI